MHKQLFLHQHEMYIVVSHGKHVAELQMHWRDYLTDTCATLDFLLKSVALLLLLFILIKLLSFSTLSYSMLPHLETYHLLRLYYSNLLCMHWLFLSGYSYEVCYTIVN